MTPEVAKLNQAVNDLDDAGVRAAPGSRCPECQAKRTLSIEVATRNVVDAARLVVAVERQAGR